MCKKMDDNINISEDDSDVGIDTILSYKRTYFRTNVTKSYEWRMAQLKALQTFVNEHGTDICIATNQDTGIGQNPSEVKLGTLSQINSEISYAIEYLESWMVPSTVSAPANLFPATAQIHSEPLGVVLILGALDFPIPLVLIPLVGAIAAGNCAVIKPSEHAPSCTQLLAKYLPNYLDTDAVSVVYGGPDVTEQLCNSTCIDHIFFTGGLTIGKKVYRAAATNLTPVTLELGGKNHVVVDETANIKMAARKILWGKYVNAGQVCVAPDYVVVVESVQDALMEAFRTVYAEFFPNDGNAGSAKKDDVYGRIVNDVHFQRLSEMMDEDPNKRGEIVVGGDRDAQSKYIAPTVYNNSKPDAKIMQDEVFGPLLPCIAVPSFDDALEFINARPKPLVTYGFSKSQTNIDRLLYETSSGGLSINEVIFHVTTQTLPFGGVGQSGTGQHDGKFSFDTFTHRKLSQQHSPGDMFDPSLQYPPGSDRKKWMMEKLI